MAELPGYHITVLRNGSPVRASSGSVSREDGRLGLSWEVTLAQPLDISKSDTWTIKRKLAGYEETLVQDARATNIAGRDGVMKSSRQISGDYGSSDTNNLLEYCVPKTMVFVNMNWARSLWPDAVIMDDILCYGSVYSSGVRITHPRLPGLEVDADEYQCIAGCDTHHKAARHLATLVGYELEVNTPDIDIIDTFTVEAGTTWKEAILANFRIWFATVDVVGTKIIVSDICSDDPDGVQKIVLTNDAIESASLNRQGRDDNTLDHLIITGRTTENTEELYEEEPDFTPVKLSAIPLSVGKTITTSRDFTKARNHKTFGEYTGEFGLPGEAESKKRLSSQSQETRFHVDETEGRKRYIPVGETIHFYDEDSTEVAKTEITYTYAKGFKPIKCVEDEYVLCHLPGVAVDSLQKVRSKITLQDQFVKPLDLTITTELVEGLILYEVIEQDGTPYKVDPQIFADIVRNDTTGDAVDTDPDTTQDTLSMTINERTTTIHRTFDDILIKRDQDYNRLSGHVKTQSQILENPIREPEDISGKNTFRREYHPDGSGESINGLTCYHPPKTIHHDDICSEAISDQIAERAFYRKYLDQNDEWTVEIPVPFLPQMLAFKVQLPDFQVRVNGALVTVSGGDFMLRQASETFEFKGKGNHTEATAVTTLTVRERY